MEILSLDLMEPLPRSSKGNQYVLVMTDYLTKFSFVVALRKATRSAIVRILEEDVFLLFGVPRIIIYDNGSHFRSS